MPRLARSIAKPPRGARPLRRLLCAGLLFGCGLPVGADQAGTTVPADTVVGAASASSPTTRLYRTREEQREAGLQTDITDWLAVSGLAEAELSHDRFEIVRGQGDERLRDEAISLQFGALVDLFGLAEAELILEYEGDTGRAFVEEAFVTLEHESWEVSAGRQYTPFGVFFSNFVSGPVLEFGETRSDEALTVSYGPSDALDLSATLYRGLAKRRGRDGGQWDWALAAEARLGSAWSAGVSYQSDLADADGWLLEDAGHRYADPVGGASAYVLYSPGPYEASFELLGATQSFAELDADRDRPLAWNAELVWPLPQRRLDLSLRVEGSEELEDEPRWRYGIAATWRIGRQASLTLEYLRAEFEGGLATNDDDKAYDHMDRFGGLLSVEF